MKYILYLAAATLAFCPLTPSAYAQRSDLDLRFHAPFPFSVGDNTFAAGDYVVTREGHLKLIFSNQENHVAALVSVLPARSSKVGNSHARIVFHRYDDQYFLSPRCRRGFRVPALVFTPRKRRRDSRMPVLRNK